MNVRLPVKVRSLTTGVEHQAGRRAGELRRAVAPAMAAAPAVIDVLSNLQHEVNGQLPAKVRAAAADAGHQAGRRAGRAGRRLGGAGRYAEHEAKTLHDAVVPAVMAALPAIIELVSNVQHEMNGQLNGQLPASVRSAVAGTSHDVGRRAHRHGRQLRGAVGPALAAAPVVVPAVADLARNIRHGRFERTLSGLTAMGALISGVEIFLEHDRASFGNSMMWIPVALSPVAVVAGIAGVFSERAAKTALPVVSAVVLVNSLQGQYLHLRGVGQRPGGWHLAKYNMEMGPPTFAPLLFGLVGGMGLVASLLRRER